MLGAHAMGAGRAPETRVKTKAFTAPEQAGSFQNGGSLISRAGSDGGDGGRMGLKNGTNGTPYMGDLREEGGFILQPDG